MYVIRTIYFLHLCSPREYRKLNVNIKGFTAAYGIQMKWLQSEHNLVHVVNNMNNNSSAFLRKHYNRHLLLLLTNTC